MRYLRQVKTTAASVALLTLTPLPASAVGCPLPGAFLEGKMQRQWVGVLLNFAGEPGAPHMGTVYATTMTASGIALTTLGKVKTHGAGAAELRGMFAKDTLYIVNNRYAPGSNDKQYEYFAIQRFGIRLGKLVSEGEGILNLSRLPVGDIASPIADCSDVSGFDKSLRNVIESGKLEQIWSPVVDPAVDPATI